MNDQNAESNDVMPKTGRFALPHCQVGVAVQGATDQEADCGEPAVARWVWPDGELYACEKHDQEIADGEEALDEIHYGNEPLPPSIQNQPVKEGE